MGITGIMGVALVTSQGGSDVEIDVVWHKNEAVGEDVTSESEGVAIIDFLYFLSAEYGEDKEDDEMHLLLNGVSFVVD